MAYLVHPTGWRLYFSKYWKSNFFSSKKEFLILFYQTKLFFSIILDSLNEYYIAENARNFFSFSNFRILLNYSTLYILIHYKLYWKNIFEELEFTDYQKGLLIKKERIFLHFKNRNYLTRLIRLKKIFMLFDKREQNFSFILHSKPEKFFKLLFMRLFFYTHILPHLMFLKNYFVNSLNKINSKVFKKVFFFGLNQKNFNINDILNLIEMLLRYKFRTNFVFYRIIKILKILRRRQKLKGFKVLLAGRFSRRDRATFLWKTFGRVSLESRLSVINYFKREIVLQYSKCIVKIWLCQG